jgi:general secretion pathway protein J
MSGTRYNPRGFTLVEMLVAVSLLGLLGVISWRGLDQVSAQRTRVNEETVDIERVVRTIAQIERDIEMSVADVLIASPPVVSALPYAMNVTIDSQQHHRVSVIRARPEGAGAQTVVYSLRATQFVRSVSAEGAGTMTSVVMLGDVRAFRVRLLILGGWVAADVFDATVSERARAIEIVIERASGERYVRVLPL